MLAFGALTLFLFVLLGIFNVNAKIEELTADISDSSQSFALFTVEQVFLAYEQYLEPGNFVSFNRELSGILARERDLEGVVLFSYAGEVLYDSFEEAQAPYAGPERLLQDASLLARVQAFNPSVLLEDGRTVYLKVQEDRTSITVDANENPVLPLGSKDRLVNIVVPHDNAYAALYTVSYGLLDARIQAARLQIGLVALLGLFATLFMTYLLTSSITNPIGELKSGALKIAGGDFKTRVRVRTRDELGVLANTFNVMAKDLAKSTQALLYKERVQKELELAAQIQAQLLPKDKLSLKHFDLAGGLIPATEVGGDAFDYITMEDGRILSYLGDVTGHGVPAGIISSVANALLYAMRNERDLPTIVERLNHVLQEKTLNKLFMTMGLALCNDALSKVSYLNAGHPPALFYSAKHQNVEEIKTKGIALGLVESVKKRIEVKNITFKANDVLVLYSDGIPEALNPKGKPYGLERLKKIVQGAGKDFYTAESIKNTIISDVFDYVGHDKVHEDDMTVLVIKRKAS